MTITIAERKRGPLNWIKFVLIPIDWVDVLRSSGQSLVATFAKFRADVVTLRTCIDFL